MCIYGLVIALQHECVLMWPILAPVCGGYCNYGFAGLGVMNMNLW